MVQQLFFLALFLCINCDKTITTITQDTTAPSYPSLYCDYFADPSEPDEGNYGDGFCSVGGSLNVTEELLLTKILVTNDGEESFAHTYTFSKSVVTRVKLMNFGRYHGATKAIGLLNEEEDGQAEIYVFVYSGKGMRMLLEVYGFKK